MNKYVFEPIKKIHFIAIITLAAIFLISITVSSNVQAQVTSSNITNSNISNTTQVIVGGGNDTYPFFGYTPLTIETKAGDTVTWKVPNGAPMEPHTVTFVINGSTMTTPDVPFSIKNSTHFTPLPPGANSEPNIVSSNGEMSTVIGNNGRAFNAVVIDADNNVFKSLHPNASFTIYGNEQYVNSGFMVAEGDSMFPGASNEFSATFENSGTYGYLCLLHPWMTGMVIVK